MLVYRVETEKGVGAYMCNAYFAGCFKRHPLPSEDGLSANERLWPGGDRDSRFGFASLQSYFDWFGGLEQDLHAGGCAVSVYEVDPEHVLTGGRQSIFDHTKAKRVARHPMHEASRMARELEPKVAA